METLANSMKASFRFTANLDYIGFGAQLDIPKKHPPIRQTLMWNGENLAGSVWSGNAKIQSLLFWIILYQIRKQYNIFDCII